MSHYAGNGTFAKILAQPSQWGVSSTSLTTIFIALSIAALSTAFRSSSNDNIYNLGGFRFVNAWVFFEKRYDFVRENFKKTGLKIFSFNLLQVSSYIQVSNIRKPRLTSPLASRGRDSW